MGLHFKGATYAIKVVGNATTCHRQNHCTLQQAGFFLHCRPFLARILFLVRFPFSLAYLFLRQNSEVNLCPAIKFLPRLFFVPQKLHAWNWRMKLYCSLFHLMEPQYRSNFREATENLRSSLKWKITITRTFLWRNSQPLQSNFSWVLVCENMWTWVGKFRV